MRRTYEGYSMKKLLTRSTVTTGVLFLSAGAALAAGAGEGIEAGFTEVGNDLNTLLTGAGGFIIVVISIMLAAVMLAIGRGWVYAATAFGCAMFLGYGVAAFQGISGVTATTDILLQAEAPASTDIFTEEPI